ncbi:transporter substrate-binding domain-containing protein [Undibacterium terreum]|uniref:Solute-binding protein family 3/N-terminal domain-containing protein n=1 Tax=Undibacterium terreum TaxID=1224302 RepID=A0A916XA38_9BURK|nr:transporter substrate-binding domain-containing protein [Undibacterium terreum]GGC58710.1 hypothetical protein GCM10011396_02010 [Undibacterium terreum]
MRYPTLMADDDPLQEYVLAALDLGLRHSGKDYQRVASSAKMQQARAIQELLSEQGQLDLLWTMTTAEREAQLLAVKIPIDKGLFGWRIALVKRGRGNIFKTVMKSKDLQAYSAGQEHDWPDTPILRSNGLPVVTATSYEALFNMLDGKRFDYFPRSVMEIWQEYREHPFHNLEVEKTIVLHYPTALYFFVSPRRPELAKDLHAGLEKAVADGSFERLFRKHLLPAIKKANIQKRRVLELSNPLLGPDSLPGKRPELWYKP